MLSYMHQRSKDEEDLIKLTNEKLATIKELSVLRRQKENLKIKIEKKFKDREMQLNTKERELEDLKTYLYQEYDKLKLALKNNVTPAEERDVIKEEVRQLSKEERKIKESILERQRNIEKTMNDAIERMKKYR